MANLRHNYVLHMIVLGLAGALLGGGAGEVIQEASRTFLEEYSVYSAAAADIRKRVDHGVLTEDQGNEALRTLNRAYRQDPYVKILRNPNIDENERNWRLGRLRTQEAGRLRLGQLGWFCAVGAILGACLGAAGPVMARNRREAKIRAAVGAGLGLVGAFLVMAAINERLHAAIPPFSTDRVNLASQILGRAAVWGVFGLFVGMGPGILGRSGKRLLIGMGGGLIGGTIAGAIFYPMYLASGSETASRLLAAVVMGVTAGLSTSLIENRLRKVWLRVIDGPAVGREFILYRNPVCLGNSRKVDIYLCDEPTIGRQHAVIRRCDGQYWAIDLNMGSPTLVNGSPVREASLKDGDRIQIGSTRLLFRERS